MGLEELRAKLAKNKGSNTPTLKSTAATNIIGNIANKFTKRDESVLEKTYQDREKQSSGGGSGKSIFNREILAQLDITEFQPQAGDHFFEALPISFNPKIPYYREVCVHFRVGLNQDAFVCEIREKVSKPCYRCQQQKLIWNSLDEEQAKARTDELKLYYPNDRAVYLCWVRTNELIKQESPNYQLSVWNSPKKKVHAEILGKARNKLHRTNLDLSDVTPGGDGRTIAFEIEKQGGWPNYKGFEIHPREEPIPEPILIQLDQVITFANESGYENLIDLLLHHPTMEEIKESMDTDPPSDEGKTDKVNKTVNEQLTQTRTPLSKFSKQSQETPADEPSEDDIIKAELEKLENEIISNLEEIQTELQEMNIIQFKAFVKKDYPKHIMVPKEEAIDLIISEMYEENMETHKATYSEYYQ